MGSEVRRKPEHDAQRLEDALAAYGRRVVTGILDETAIERVTSWHHVDRYGDFEVFVLVNFLEPNGTDRVLLLHGTEQDLGDEGEETGLPEGLRSGFSEVYLCAEAVKRLRGALGGA